MEELLDTLFENRAEPLDFINSCNGIGSVELKKACLANNSERGSIIIVDPHTGDILDLISDVYPSMEPAQSVLQTSLQNANPIIHPAVTLSNAARIEMTGGDFLFYEDGVSDSVGRLIEALDKERIAIGKELGITILPDPEMGMRQGYMLENNYGSGYRKAPGFLGIGAQPQLDHRYLNEDVGYGLVFMSKLGQQIGVATPGIDAVISVATIVMARDYRAEALRTPESLGIAGRSAKELAAL